VKKSFRRSRVAMILDICLFPIMIPYSVLIQGIPMTVDEIASWARNFKDDWQKADWFSGE
jgi:hypothetical protein